MTADLVYNRVFDDKLAARECSCLSNSGVVAVNITNGDIVNEVVQDVTYLPVSYRCNVRRS